MSSQGILIFAFNNGKIDYVSLAVEAARRAKLHLKKPVALVTEDASALLNYNLENVFDTVIDIADSDSLKSVFSKNNLRRFNNGTDVHRNVSFKNELRTKTYELSPYDETLVIDCDYLISNDSLKYCWEQPENFLIWKGGSDLSGFRENKEFVRLHDTSIDFYWATVFFFRKSQEARVFFDLIDYIRENWSYYKLLYQFNTTVFRNDHAFSIAIHIMNNLTEGGWAQPLPGNILYTIDRDLVYNIDGDSFTFMIEKEFNPGSYTLVNTKGLNVHVMNKFSLLSALGVTNE